MKFAVIMDPIESIHPKKDTTLALLLAAQRQQFPIYYMEINDLILRNDVPYAYTKKLRVMDDFKQWFEIEKEEILPLDYFDVVLMRKDPPVNQAYLHATQILDFAVKKKIRVYNKPQSLRDYNEKLAAQHFAHLCPETLVSTEIDHIKHFITEYKDVICKPVDEMGGSNVFKVSSRDPNLNVILETLTQRGHKHIICQRYLPEIKLGDKRIIMVNGKPIPYALARIPQPGETRGNLAAGGVGRGIELSASDYKICEEVGPFLKEKGLFLAGIDVIGSHLTEINITSPTCVRELEAIYKLDIAGQIINELAS